MKTYWKIILIIIDLATFGFGSWLFIHGLINLLVLKDYYGDIDPGFLLIILGFLVHHWRKNYFKN